jgi:hypothetical protein
MRAEEGLDFAASVAARVAAGRLSREKAEIALAEALRADCPACSGNYDEALAALFGQPTTASGCSVSPSARDRMAEFLRETAVGFAIHGGGSASPPSMRRQRPPTSSELSARAERALATLKPERWARRRERVALEWHRFRGSAVARQFLEEARAALPGRPEDSEHWAELALLALGGNRNELYPDEEEKVVLRLRARLFQANALRCRGDLAAANEELALTVSVADELDIRGLSFWAEVKSFSASLRRDHRDFPAAIREARAAGALCRAAGEPRNEVKARWQLTSIYEQVRDFNAALVAVRQAVPGAMELNDPVLELGVRHSEVAVLARAGHTSEAAERFEALGPLYRQFRDWENFQLWVAGLISVGLGRRIEAEDSFRAARDGFLSDKNPYDAALVTLDWTLFLLDQNRAEEVLPLAVSMGQAFEGLGVARETLASWNVFAEAAARREVTRTAAEGLVRSLGTERSAPPRGR